MVVLKPTASLRLTGFKAADFQQHKDLGHYCPRRRGGFEDLDTFDRCFPQTGAVVSFLTALQTIKVQSLMLPPQQKMLRFGFRRFWQPKCCLRPEEMKRESDTLNNRRILLVEDERVARETLRRLLEQDSHTVIEANNGAEALALFRNSRFDLVVVDYEMPFIKGNELAANIKRVAPNQPILMITAFHHRPSKDNPVDAVVNKPFRCAHLREVMSKLLSQPAANAELDTERIERCPAV